MEQIFQLIQSFDESFLLWIQETIRTPWLTPIMQFLSTIYNAGRFSILLCILFLLFKKTRKLGLTATTSLLLGTLVTNIILKNLVGRLRPYQVLETLETLTRLPHDSSFPSGHTCAAFTVAGVIFFCCSRKIGIPALIFASFVGISRLYLGVHFLTDVLGGAMIGIIVSYIACFLWNTRKE